VALSSSGFCRALMRRVSSMRSTSGTRRGLAGVMSLQVPLPRARSEEGKRIRAFRPFVGEGRSGRAKGIYESLVRKGRMFGSVVLRIAMVLRALEYLAI